MDIFPYRYRPGQREMVDFIDRASRDGMCPVIEAGTGTGKTITALAGTIPLAREKGLKIVYLTRTKSQQTQVVRECGAIGGVVCAAMQGRSASTCPMMRGDPDLRSGTPEEIAKLCSEYKRRTEKGFGCPFFANLEGISIEHWLDVLRSSQGPSAFAEVCEGASVCPYELMKHLLPYADVVAVAYPFVFIDQILSNLQEWTGVPLDRMLIIVDEAHNLPDYLRELQTYEYSRYSIDMAEKEARREGDQELHEGITITDLAAVIREMLDATLKEYLIDEDGLIPPHHVEEELMSRLGVTSVSLSRMARGLRDIGDIIEEKLKQKRKLPRSYIGMMGRFLDAWMSEPDGYAVRLVIGGSNPCFQTYCMDPSPAAWSLNQCAASLLMSGTLEPLEDFAKEIGLERPALRRVPSPFPLDNLLTLYTDRVSMRYEDRALEDNYRLLMRMATDAICAVRVNTAVFFPSYDFMDRMVADGFAEGLGRDVYYERRGMPQGELMETFESFRTSEGSVLFAVTGGRISEGLDFPDKALELVVMIGIPFPKPTAKSRAMVRYYDSRFGDGRRYVTIIPANRKMRQSIGRLIRSETDRGVAVLLDKRIPAMGLGAMLCSDIPSAEQAFFRDGATDTSDSNQRRERNR